MAPERASTHPGPTAAPKAEEAEEEEGQDGELLLLLGGTSDVGSGDVGSGGVAAARSSPETLFPSFLLLPMAFARKAAASTSKKAAPTWPCFAAQRTFLRRLRRRRREGRRWRLGTLFLGVGVVVVVVVVVDDLRGGAQSVRQPQGDPAVPGHDDAAGPPQGGGRGGHAVGVAQVDYPRVFGLFLLLLLLSALREARQEALRDGAGRRHQDVKLQPRRRSSSSSLAFSSFLRHHKLHLELLGLEVDTQGFAADDGEVGRGEGRGVHGGD